MPLTKKTHYNPCFWTAYWNREYLERILTNTDDGKPSSPRQQKVFCLSLASNTVFQQKTEKIFFQEGTGLSHMNNESILDYCKRTFPDDLVSLEKYFEEKGDGDYLLDFENIFKNFEDSVKENVRRVITQGTVTNSVDKTHIAMFILLQSIRNPNHINEMIDKFTAKNLHRFEFFLNFRSILQDTNAMYSFAFPFIISKWTFYNNDEDIFILSDKSVLPINGKKVMFALSPRLLLEVDLRKKNPYNLQCIKKDHINFSKLHDFEKLVINNCDTYIIFSNRNKLELLKDSENFKNRRNYRVMKQL